MTYLWCPGCNFETLRNADGTCGFCVPERRVSEYYHNDHCLNCGEAFPPMETGGHRKKYCSRKCQKYAWEKQYRRRRTDRQNERR